MWMIRDSVDYFFRVLDFLILARMMLSWVNTGSYGSISRIIYQLTEPILAPFRNLFFRFGLGRGTIDFSPILAVFALDIIRKMILSML